MEAFLDVFIPLAWFVNGAFWWEFIICPAEDIRGNHQTAER